MWCERPSVVGAVIGNYQIVRKLGEGGMGAVYLGQHQLLGRRAAIKILLPELSARPEIVHRGLKPENVFLVPDAEVASGERSKILDFGIAKLSDDHPGKLTTQIGMLMGTPTYMSPEQCRGLSEVDHRSDIYSLGCVLFH